MTPRLAEIAVKIGLAVVLIALAVVSARAHDWYPALCCSGKDCHPTGAAEGAREPAAQWTAEGWRLHDGKTFKHKDVQQSPDGLFHVCRRNGDPLGEVIHVDGKPCVFAPGLGS